MTTPHHRTASRTGIPAVLLVLTAVLAGCGDAGSPGTSPASSTADGTSDTPTPSEDTVQPSDLTPITPEPAPVSPGVLPTGPVPDAIAGRADVRAAVAAEAERRGVEVSEVTVAGYADVTWSDGSLGCPEPGMMYTQALVPGHQLVLEVDGELASYHAAQGRDFTYCASPVPPSASSPTR